MESWISALSSLVLVGVTAWYAILTHKLAKSARESADSAARTASLAAEALAANVAALDVNFSVFPNARGDSESDGLALGVSVHCTGATVFVHRVHLDEAYRLDSFGPDGASYTSIAKDIALVVDDSGDLNSLPVTLPVRMHKGEMVHFNTHPRVIRDSEERTGTLEVSIWYSLSGQGDQLVRDIDYVTSGDD